MGHFAYCFSLHIHYAMANLTEYAPLAFKWSHPNSFYTEKWNTPTTVPRLKGSLIVEQNWLCVTDSFHICNKTKQILIVSNHIMPLKLTYWGEWNNTSPASSISDQCYSTAHVRLINSQQCSLTAMQCFFATSLLAVTFTFLKNISWLLLLF